MTFAGVIEGFYGQPWSQAERLQLFEWMHRWRLNTYFYAPKDDLKHRTIWREPYSSSEAEGLAQLITGCRERDIRFVYALSPGLDIRYSSEADLDCIRDRLAQIRNLGCQSFALLFDDIPDQVAAEDLKRWGSLASAQCHVANTLFKWAASECFLFCPTAYCGRMAENKHGGPDYLTILGRELLPEIDVFWTGPEIISREITVEHVGNVATLLRRKPVIWDNLHANDYDGRRFYCGPYAGRPLELRGAVNGLLINPNNEFPLNYVPLRTFAQFVHWPGGKKWDSRDAYLSAMREWLEQFATIGEPVTLEDLILLGDCYYLPYEEGPEAEALYQRAKTLLAGKSTHDAFRQESSRLREFCGRLAALRNRPLFYALSRRIWELREELDLLERCVGTKQPWTSHSHLPGTYRGGMVARLQRLLHQRPDGTFVAAQSDE